MRNSFLSVWISFKLLTGRMLIPVLFLKNHPRFFPSPRRATYKKHLADYFFKN
ncbi:MAG: hypothetical protein Kow0037_29810 [Calditrichia bacterium]